MAAFEPFRAIRYNSSIDPALATSPPYDVISGAERRRLESLHAANIVSVILPAEPAGPGTTRYEAGAAVLRSWLASGILVADDRSRLFAYRMDYAIGDRRGATGGLVGALALEDLGAGGGAGGIHPHEHTMPKPRSDRLELMRTTEANLEPIWLIGGEGVVGAAVETPPTTALIDFEDPAGVRHRLWPLSEEAGVAASAAIRGPLVIADGHHRYAAAITYRDERRAAGGPGPWDRTLALVSDPVQAPPALLPIHRLVDLTVGDLPPSAELRSFDGDLAALARHLGTVGPGTVGVADAAGRWTMASYVRPDSAWLAGFLDEVDAIGSVSYEHDLAEVAAGIEAGRLAFLLAPIPVGDVVEAALAGRVMPPKSTLFWPKPRTGLVLRDLRNP